MPRKTDGDNASTVREIVDILLGKLKKNTIHILDGVMGFWNKLCPNVLYMY